MRKTDTPAKVASTVGLGLLPITRHDHPEPQTMVWSELELHAIRVYAGRCLAAERERLASKFMALAKEAHDAGHYSKRAELSACAGWVLKA